MRRSARPFEVATSLVLVLALSLASCADDDVDRAGGRDRGDVVSTSASPATGPAPAGAAGTAGCGRPPDVATVSDERPGDVEQTFTSGGNERVYRLAIPASYDPTVPAPLVVNLHGSGSSALEASAYGDVPRAAAKRGMLVVAPQAIGGRWELGGTGDDAEFLDALIDDLEARYCIDEDRVHLVGMSLGAWKAAATACADRGRFASVALVTVEVFPGRCDPMPVIAFHGTADHTVPYGAGADPGVVVTGSNAGLPGALQNIAAWADNGGCDPDPTVTEIGSDVVLRTYGGCDDGIDVQLYTIEGGGHTWPGSDIDLGPASQTTHTIDATKLILDWFEAHPRPG